MAVHVDGENAGYLGFLFTMDPEEEMAIRFWEMGYIQNSRTMACYRR